MEKIDNLIIVPARKGSKGVKNKNFKKFKNKPLYQISLDQANLLKKNFKSSIVAFSTDLNFKKKFKYDFIYIKRPKKISGDKSKSKEYIIHTLNYFLKKKIRFKNIIILQPACPLRRKKDLISAMDMFLKNKSDSLISAYEDHYINPSVIYKRSGIFGLPFSKNHNNGIGRINKNIKYIRNGCIYIVKSSYFMKTKNIISSRPLIYIMPKVYSINIDTYDDLEMYKKLDIN